MRNGSLNVIFEREVISHSHKKIFQAWSLLLGIWDHTNLCKEGCFFLHCSLITHTKLISLVVFQLEFHFRFFSFVIFMGFLSLSPVIFWDGCKYLINNSVFLSCLYFYTCSLYLYLYFLNTVFVMMHTGRQFSCF